ncbi:MAG: hypothetical protein AB7K67_12020 [Hyphomicrobiaceae bacterium]
MDKRLRSPNYPSISLKEAIEKIAVLYQAYQQHPATREVVAKGLGYNSLNGASATVISALNKYGLLEGRGEDLRVSERALSILHPHTPAERIEALRDAALEPKLFADLNEKFPGGITSDELLRNYLLRNGFAVNAVTHAIQAYRETSEFVTQESGRYAVAPTVPKEPAKVEASTVDQVSASSRRVKQEENQDDMRVLHRFDFPRGGRIEVRISRNVDALVALKILEMNLPGVKLATELASSDAAEPDSDISAVLSGHDDEETDNNA